MPALDITSARAVAVEAVSRAGEHVFSRLFDGNWVRAKGFDGDIVTGLDFSAERIIVDHIRRSYPDHFIVSEEAGSHGEPSSEFTWLVDPLDGTNNVAIGLPVVAVGVALCRSGVPIVGAVNDPVSRRTWSAVQDGDATGPHGTVMRVPDRSGSKRPIIAWQQGYGVQRVGAVRLLIQSLSDHGQRLLDLWSPLTNWAMIARGEIDGIVAFDVGDLDLHGGRLIASQAGVQIVDFRGHPSGTTFRGLGATHRIVAGLPGYVAELTDIVKSVELPPPA